MSFNLFFLFLLPFFFLFLIISSLANMRPWCVLLELPLCFWVQARAALASVFWPDTKNLSSFLAGLHVRHFYIRKICVHRLKKTNSPPALRLANCHFIKRPFFSLIIGQVCVYRKLILVNYLASCQFSSQDKVNKLSQYPRTSAALRPCGIIWVKFGRCQICQT